MTPYATLGGGRQPTVTLYHGDVLEVLRGLEVASVHCVVTSPPYWGLRDYGTGTWEGGDPGCEHLRAGTHVSQKSTLRSDGREHVGPYDGEKQVINGLPYAAICGRCGARRVDRQIGLEALPFCANWERGPRCTQCWVCAMVGVFEAVKRVLHPSGTVWINCGDAYTSGGRTSWCADARLPIRGRDGRPPTPPTLKPKDLCGLPWRLALALQAAGWWLRQDIIWSKAACLPESVQDRCTKSHEYLFLMSKQPTYYFDSLAIREEAVKGAAGSRFDVGKTGVNGYGRVQEGYRDHGVEAGRNRRSVWHLGPEQFPGAHFATFPQKLVEPCVLAGSSASGVCGACGAPWTRVVERAFHPQADIKDPAKLAKGAGKRLDASNGWSETPRGTTAVTTTGWQPSCACNAGVQRAVVLDPFAGSGTTGLVVQQHGRDAILIDLSRDYLDLAIQRLTPALAQLPLFGLPPARER